MDPQPAIHRLQGDNLCRTLGMTFLATTDPDTVQATMPVDGRTCQPFGCLSGGAALALAESVAGVGSLTICPDVLSVGANVSANHVNPARQGDTVTATARIVSRGHRLHVWHVDIRDTQGTLISTAQVTNYITSRPLA